MKIFYFDFKFTPFNPEISQNNKNKNKAILILYSWYDLQTNVQGS